MKWIVLSICIIVGVAIIAGIAVVIDSFTHRIKTRISFKQSLQKSELIIIPLYNNGVKLNFIVDSGSNVNVLDAQHLSKLTLLKEKRDVSKIQTAGLGGEKGTECIVSMALEGKREEFYETFYVMDISKALLWAQEEYGETVHGLLGVEFLRNYGKVLDFNNCIIYSK